MKFFKEGELKLLWPFYLDMTISRMLQFAPAFLVPYFWFLGLSATQIGILIAILPLFMLLFEIPTGAIADLYGRKFSVLLGYFLEGIGFLSLFFFTNYYALLGIFAFIGIGATFSSGSKEAWIADLIKSKKSDLLHTYFVKEQTFQSFGLIISGFIGAIIVASLGLKYIWMFLFLSFVVSIIILSFSKEIFVRKEITIKESYKKILKQSNKSISYSRKHPVLFYFLLANFIIVFAAAFDEGLSWSPFLIELGFPEYGFGFLWSAMNGMFMISPWISHRFMKKNKERKFIIGMIFLSLIITSMVLFVQNYMLAVLITIFSLFFFSARYPAERIFFHKFIPSKLRATIGSIESMILSIATIIAMPLVGFAVDHLGARYTIFLTVILTIPGLIIYSRIKENDIK